MKDWRKKRWAATLTRGPFSESSFNYINQKDTETCAAGENSEIYAFFSTAKLVKAFDFYYWVNYVAEGDGI